MTTVVISYRRDDSKEITGRIFDHLERHFGPGQVLMDVNSIPYGEKFPAYLKQKLEICDILIAVVGPQWAGTNEKGELRIQEKTDWVRIEIATVLARNIPVIPLLIDDTEMPDRAILPEDLLDFADRQAARIRSEDFRNHIGRLLESMDEQLAGRAQPSKTNSSPDFRSYPGRLLKSADTLLASIALETPQTPSPAKEEAAPATDRPEDPSAKQVTAPGKEPALNRRAVGRLVLLVLVNVVAWSWAADQREITGWVGAGLGLLAAASLFALFRLGKIEKQRASS